MAKKDKYIEFSGVKVSGGLDEKDDILVVITEDIEVDIVELLKEHAGSYIKIEISNVREILE